LVEPLRICDQHAPRATWYNSYKEPNPEDPHQLAFQSKLGGLANCSLHINQGKQTLIWEFQPDPSGVLISATLTTEDDLPGIFGLQQCLRFTGAFNQAWRRQVACTPFLSEFDLQAIGQPNRTLTYARFQEAWYPFPVPYTELITPAAIHIPQFDPAGMVDHGLIIRQTVDRSISPEWYWELVAPGTQWQTLSSGMYWERTLSISNRHPADCLHALVNFGPLPAGGKRTIYGKFYWIQGDREDLLNIWCRDFGIQQNVNSL
jgi:hypothetical protein